MFRAHGELRQASCLGLLCDGPALNRCTILRMATFFWIPVVRLSRFHQTRNTCGEDEECPCTNQWACRNRHEVLSSTSRMTITLRHIVNDATNRLRTGLSKAAGSKVNPDIRSRSWTIRRKPTGSRTASTRAKLAYR